MVSHNILAQVKQIVLRKEYRLLQDLFLQMLTNNNPSSVLPEIWESIEYLTRPTINLISHAQSLSIFVTEHLLTRYEQENRYETQILEHLRKTAHLIQSDRKLRQKIIQIYKKLHPDTINLDVLIRLSGLDELNLYTHGKTESDLSHAITKLDKLINLGDGNPIYSSRFGYGEVSQTDFLLDSVSIDFFSNQTQTITLEQALKSLQIIPKDNFYYLKEKKPALILHMTKENPQALINILMRDVGEYITSAEIKKLLSTIIPDKDITAFIGFIKKSKIKPKPKTIAVNDKTVIDYNSIPTITQEQIIELIIRVSSVSKQKILTTIKEKRDDWQELYSRIFETQTGNKTLQTIFANLNQTTQQKITDKIFTEYKNFPAQFLYLSNFAGSKTLDRYSILIRYLDLTTQKLEKVSLASEIRNRIIANNFHLLSSALSQITSDTAQRIFERIQVIKNFYPEELDGIKKIFREKFPELFKEPTDYIYHTETAIKNKSAELRKLISEEIPKVAQEIGHARSYGDLRENFEFKAAKEKQRRLLAQITQIRHDLTKSRPIDLRKIDTGKVSIGATVKLVSLPDTNQVVIYSILGPWDSDVAKGIISYLAPFAQNLLNKKVGDEITDTEGKTYKIVEVKIAAL